MRNNKQETWWGRQGFDSEEEGLFSFWIAEAEQYGLISSPQYHPPEYRLFENDTVFLSIPLKTKIRQVEKTLLDRHSYQADWSFTITRDFQQPIYTKNIRELMFYPLTGQVVIDIKGGWADRGSSQEFAVNRKWIRAKYGVYVCKIVPDKLFLKTWCPAKGRRTEKRRTVREKFRQTRTAEQFLALLP